MDLNYCPSCGSALETRQIENRDRRYCPTCSKPIYRNPKPYAGVLVVDAAIVLLVERNPGLFRPGISNTMNHPGIPRCVNSRRKRDSGLPNQP